MKRSLLVVVGGGLAWIVAIQGLRENPSAAQSATNLSTTELSIAAELAGRDADTARLQAEELLQMNAHAGGRESFERGRKQALIVRALKNAKSDEERDKAKSQLREWLTGEFDRMIAGEEKALDQLESRLEKLREQVQRRREAKSKLVDLRFETLLNEINGLGWPGGQVNAPWGGAEGLFPTVSGFYAPAVAPAPFAPSPAQESR